jgi:predicted phosphodiesterase
VEKCESHDLIAALKSHTVELGHFPTKEELRVLGLYAKVIRVFKNITTARISAGVDRKNPGAEKTKYKLECDVNKILSGHKFLPRSLPDYPTTLVIGDCHFPFVDQAALTMVYAVCEYVQPQRIVQIGDLYDFFAHSKFPRSQIGYEPKGEIEAGRGAASEMWSSLRRIAPLASCYQILGNHDFRPLKRILERYPEGEIFLELHKWFQFDGVELRPEMRTPLEIDGVVFEHGYKNKLGDHAAHNQKNTVVGHSHRGGVHWRGTVWELNAGYIGDPQSKAMSYTASKITDWTPGCGVIDGFGPRFIHFGAA